MEHMLPAFPIVNASVLQGDEELLVLDQLVVHLLRDDHGLPAVFVRDVDRSPGHQSSYPLNARTITIRMMPTTISRQIAFSTACLLFRNSIITRPAGTGEDRGARACGPCSTPTPRP